MREHGFHETAQGILTEIRGVLARVSAEEVAALEDALATAGTVFVAGAGRSGLVARCFAMRLTHLGLRAHAVGDTTAPPIAAADLLVAISGSGETDTTCSLAKRAAALGARVVAVTGAAGSSLARLAHLTVVIPSSPSQQFGGTLFEQTAVVLLDAAALRLQQRLAQTTEQMEARHANLE